jgi:glycosyltransferase involved in cell wall biosynthesis
MRYRPENNNPKLRICMLTDCYPPAIGGIEVHVYSLASELTQLGHSVDVVTHRSLLSEAEQCFAPTSLSEQPCGVTVHRLEGYVARVRGADPVIDPRIVREVQHILTATYYDVVHVHSFGSILGLVGLRTAKKLGVPALVTKHSLVMAPTRPALINRILLQVEYWIAKQWVDGIIAVSQASADEIVGLGLPIYVIPSGVDSERWRPDADLRARMRGMLGYGEDHIVIGYLSRMVPSKGAAILPNLAERMACLVPNARFLAIGDGPLRQRLQGEIDKLGLQTIFTLLGSRPWQDTPAYLNAMDIFVFPSYREAFGLALVEAMSCGLPSVARISAGAKEILSHGESGYLAATDEEILHWVIELAQNKALRQAMGSCARLRVQQRYNWKIAAEKTTEVYRELLSRKRG